METAFCCDLTLVAAFAIDDPIRPGVKEIIKKCKESGVIIRLVTSENMYCARAVALKAGIISKQMAQEEQVCMEGKEFYDYIGGV